MITYVYLLQETIGLMARKFTTKDFIEQSRTVHGEVFDYSKVTYTTARDPVVIICPVHGEFEQIAHTHMRGRGCAKCSAKKMAVKRSMKIASEYIDRVKKVHGELYDLSLVRYSSAKEPVVVICGRHGRFEIRADVFESGSICPKCSYEKRGQDKADSFEEFVDKGQRLHADLYRYPHQVYKNAFTHVDIECRTHGVFSQIPNSHLSGNGCPKCVHHVSSGEEEIANFVRNMAPDLQTSVRTIVPPKEIDMYSEQHQIGIEYCGLYWHTENRGKNKTYHIEKLDGCLKKGINLITIFEDEWIHNTDKVQSRLTQLFGATPQRIAARKCEIEIVSSSECSLFMNANHIQGADISSVRFGLRYHGELVSIMTFVKPRFSKTYQWEMSRFCSKNGISITGAAGKLFSNFLREHNPSSVVTYADLRYGRGYFYKHLGFKHSHDSNPNYWYVAPGSTIRESRMKYQKHKLIKEGFDPGKSEWQIMQERGYDRIWDCGNAVWVWNKN